MRNFRDYDIWQKAIRLAVNVYKLTASFPPDQRFVLVAQLQRAAVSISSNIAEGCSRPSPMEFARFLEIAMGSSFETQSQLILAEKLQFLSENDLNTVSAEIAELQKQINTLISKIRNSHLQKPMANG